MKTSIQRYQGLTIHVLASPAVFEQLTAILEDLDLQVEPLSDYAAARRALRAGHPSLVICEESLIAASDGAMVDLIESNPEADFIVVTGEPNYVTLLQLFGLGIDAYLSLPVSAAELTGFLGRYLDRDARLPRAIEAGRREKFAFPGVVGESTSMNQVIDLLSKAAPVDIPVLILGENGTGKELAARAIHANSPRRKKPFIAVHLGAVSSTLIESELFGYVKGSHSQAFKDHTGYIEAADGGTLFLDELGDIPLEVQVKLLRVLEQREFTRIGETRPRKCDFRLVSATNRDLETMIDSGDFREDLYFRVRGLIVTMPALRDRLKDIPMLVKRFVEDHNAQYPDRRIREVPQETLEALKRQPWRGNVRELMQDLKVAAVFADDGVLRYGSNLPALSHEESSDGIDAYLDKGLKIDDIQRIVIERALKRNDGNRKKTAEQLGIAERTFYRMLDKYKLKKK